MHTRARTLIGAVTGLVLVSGGAEAADCEVLHWWTSKGESAAVEVLAESFNALSGETWVDGAIEGSREKAVPIITERIKGDNPPCAAQMVTGRGADELIEAGLMQDLTELATEEGWANIVRPKSQLEACIRDGKVYCVPVNIHSSEWMWTNRKVYQDVGLAPPRNWDEMVLFAPRLRENGIIPLAVAKGIPTAILLATLVPAVGGSDLYHRIFEEKDPEVAGSAEMTEVFNAMDDARNLVDPGEVVDQWNDAVDQVIAGKAGAIVEGDYAQAEFQAAGLVPLQDYDCLPGLGIHPILNTGGDVFYFPKSDDPAISEAQRKMASMIISKPVQVAFNEKKGSLPIRADIDLEEANACMEIGLNILDSPKNVLLNPSQVMDTDTVRQIAELFLAFFNDRNMAVEDAQANLVEIIEKAPK